MAFSLSSPRVPIIPIHQNPSQIPYFPRNLYLSLQKGPQSLLITSSDMVGISSWPFLGRLHITVFSLFAPLLYYIYCEIMDFFLMSTLCVCSLSVMSDSLRPHGLWPTQLLCPRHFPGRNTGVECHFLFQLIFPTQGSNLHLGSPTLAGRFFTTNTTREAQYQLQQLQTLVHNCCSINTVNITLTNIWVGKKYLHDLWNKEEGKRSKYVSRCSPSRPASLAFPRHVLQR